LIAHALSSPHAVWAHPSMAEAPLFGMAADCVQVVDKQMTEVLHVSYTVGADDTALVQGDIAVPDAKTHQFFAFRGALLAHDFGEELFPFAPPGAASIVLPSWITNADVKRAARATNTLDGTAFSEADIPAGAVLDAEPTLAGSYLRVTADDARVPITLAQSLAGVDWALADVDPGLYTFAGYVFSPPYNGWAPRAQLIEIVDGSAAGPVANIERIEGGLFPYQGRKVRGCVATPEGSQLKGWFTVVDRPESGWIEWLPSEAVTSGPLSLCFRDPRPELTGSVRLRFDLTAPDGTTRSFYSPDTVAALPGSGACAEGEDVCCPAGTEVARTPPSRCSSGACARDAGAVASDGATSPNAGPAASAGARAGATGQDRGTDPQDPGSEEGSGCTIARSAPHRSSLAVALWIASGLTFAGTRLTRRRRHRKTAHAAQRGAEGPGCGHVDAGD
jgi:hypothetical protein